MLDISLASEFSLLSVVQLVKKKKQAISLLKKKKNSIKQPKE